MIESHDTVTVALAQQPGMPTGAAHVMYNSENGHAHVRRPARARARRKNLPALARPGGRQTDQRRRIQSRRRSADHWMVALPPAPRPRPSR